MDKDTKNLKTQLYDHIEFIYGQDQAAKINHQIQALLDRFRLAHPGLSAANPKDRISELDAILITYGDMVQAPDQAPLQTTGAFFRETIGDIISTVHFLPFFPYSSDDGFSVIDYYQVNPDYGDWEDISSLGEHFRLMFDAVVNHISAKSEWFTAFLAGNPKYTDYFYVVDSHFDISKVFRPRALPLLTEFDTLTGPKKVWTTFSKDQIDLNYECPELLLEIIQVLLKYVAEGADFIRLDAIAFIWKESGTRCLHQPQTHRIIQLMRTILDMVAPGVSIITETNVPHGENIAYFGDGFNEAQLVYNFSLPPLTLHALQTGSSAVLTKWAAELTIPSDQTTFFNFLASHDGIGLMPARGFLSQDEIAAIADRVLALGGLVSYKNNPDGTQSPYELNINFLDALGDPQKPDEDIEQVARRFLVTQSIMLTLRGVPGIYFHSLFGSRNWIEGVAQTGRNRTINRQKLQLDELRQELANPDSLRQPVFKGFHRMLQVRQANPAFHPMASQQVLDLGSAVFAVFRFSLDQESQILCLHNLTDKSVDLEIDLSTLPVGNGNAVVELLTENAYQIVDSKLTIQLSPYQVSWLKMQSIQTQYNR
jgi:sucrose phosphorylase